MGYRRLMQHRRCCSRLGDEKQGENKKKAMVNSFERSKINKCAKSEVKIKRAKSK